MSLPLPTPANTVDDGDVEMPEAPAATANNSINLDDHFLFLTRDEAEQVLKFRDNVRVCQTDNEKYNLCTPIRDTLLDKRTGLELLANVYHHIIQAECPGYAKWKTSQRRIKRKRNAEEDAAQGKKYYEKLNAAAYIVPESPGSRIIRDSVNPIDQIDLAKLKTWSHRRPFVYQGNSNEPRFPFEPLAADNLPNGFSLDQFSLMVRSQHTAQPSLAPAISPDAIDISPSTDPANAEEPQPSAASPTTTAADVALDRQLMDFVDDILEEENANNAHRRPPDHPNGSNGPPTAT